MLFSAILRTGQVFGAGHIIDVLRGGDTDKIRARGHDALPTYGVGKDKPKPFWQGLIRQAVAGGYLLVDMDQYGGLKLTPRGEAVLKGRESFELREIIAGKGGEKKPRRSAASKAAEADVDAGLLSALKGLRREIAAERKVPAYVVFSDATLIDMCHLKPRNLEEMAAVNGVGPKKLTEFGERFLAEMLDA
jgi:ATP-dependent DNA helicase RecQ